jgi:hypothetical protein
MKAWWIGALAASALLWSSPARAEVRVTIGDGQVSVAATNATVRQILAEWARVGQARIVNLDRLTGPPATIEISNASEIDALEILLRSVGGYIIAPRHVDLPNASRFDRIVILPVSSVPAPAIRPPAAAGGAATFPQPQSQLLPPPRRLDEDDGDSPERASAAPGAPAQRPPMFNTFPQPARGVGQPQNAQEPGAPAPPAPPAPAAPSSMPTAPAGVPVPGMVLPAPQAAPGATQPR